MVERHESKYVSMWTWEVNKSILYNVVIQLPKGIGVWTKVPTYVKVGLSIQSQQIGASVC